MSKEKIIKVVKRKMGEPIVKHLTNEYYENNYNLVERILTETKLNLKFKSNVCKLLHRQMLEIICKNSIENKLKQ